MAASLRVGRLLGTSLRAGWIATRGYSNGASMIPLTFGSPYESFYDNVNVKQVDVSATTGSFGILPDHVPAVSVLKPGLVTIYEDDNKTVKYFASSGTVTINTDSTVQILAEEAVPLDRLDAQAARTGLEKCQQKLTSSSSEQDRAEANIGVELYEAMLKALEGN
ncbi:ATP synthase subunit delta, mitochondrial-like [Halichondria panicea]|uniref:ATP synthase subunit delta, mitochondrial-like n=1 Tax=Halichondria panicea TaxID=6063 RepID=UPI00312B859F